MAKGWVLIHRQIQDCSIWLDNEPFDRRSAWIDLLLLVNHTDKEIIFNGSPVTIERGQYLTSVRKLAERWGWSRDRVSRYLKLLEDLKMITKESDSTRTLITIENYGIYQDLQDSDKDSNKDSVEDSNKDSDKAQTNNVKNVKNVKKKYIAPGKIIFGEYKHVKLTEDEFVRLAKDYGSVKRDEAIKFLDEYIEQHPKYKNESHNLCIRGWVLNAVEERKRKSPPPGKFQPMNRADYDMDAIEKLLTGG